MQIVAGVRDGALIAGTRLPTVRGLAKELGIAPNTVARTYRELERQGVLVTRGRSGTFIADGVDPSRAAAERAAAEYVRIARRLGVRDEEIVELVDGAVRGPVETG